ncbi:MAG: hypothetical protein J6T23_02455 [Elusimicrobia bacterium]|nr:hypothetical protein [Elusimicrobiota bacterium]
MYNNPYFNNVYNPQANLDKINEQISQLEKMRQQMQQPVQTPQPTNLTQNFQLAPTNHTMKFVNTIDDVNKEIVYYDTPFFSKDMTVMWIKNTKGDIKSYELNEIVPKDAKDMQIEYLQAQIEELRGKIENDADVKNVNTKQNATDTAEYVETDGTTIEKAESTSVSKVSRSKKEQ